jgi:hypothetical protein
VKRLELSRNGVHIRILRVGHGGIVLRFETAIPVVACGLDQDFLLVVECGYFFFLYLILFLIAYGSILIWGWRMVN